jgi:hypothetical protein
MEKCCQVQLLAEAASGGNTKQMNEADAAFTAKSVDNPNVGWFSMQPMFDVMIEQVGDAYLQ